MYRQKLDLGIFKNTSILMRNDPPSIDTEEYLKFVNSIIKPYLGCGNIFAQKHPRIFYHKPQDIGYDIIVDQDLIINNKDELVVIVPFTNIFGTNTIWLGDVNQTNAWSNFSTFSIFNITEFNRPKLLTNTTPYSSLFFMFVCVCGNKYSFEDFNKLHSKNNIGNLFINI